MKRTFLAIGLALALGTTSVAKTPKEVLEPYKAYRAALAADQKSEAADFAYKAWQIAEDLMGDSKTTGDLASNFAELRPRYMNEKQAWKQVMKAHKRAIDLASLHTSEPDVVEIDRRIKYLSWQIPNLSKNVPGAKSKKYSTARLKERIIETGMQGSTFHAETLALSAQAAMINEDWDDVKTESLAALDLFDNRTDAIASIYEYAVPIYLARAYSELESPIDAALTYQTLMTKLEVRGGHNNPISADAYAEWLRLRDEVAEMKSTNPRALEVVNFTVPAGRTTELLPLVRMPPKFPSSFTRGSKSGFVKLKFNVDIDGRVINPIVVSSTKESLHEAALDCLKDWRYTPNLPEGKSRDVETTIRFDLLASSGRRLPYGEEKSRL